MGTEEVNRKKPVKIYANPATLAQCAAWAADRGLYYKGSPNISAGLAGIVSEWRGGLPEESVAALDQTIERLAAEPPARPARLRGRLATMTGTHRTEAKRKILAALTVSNGDAADAARILRVTTDALQWSIDTLYLGPEIERKWPAKGAA